MGARYDAIVIGGGANGLAAAVTLARARRRVLVVERREVLGGQGRTVEFAPGFRADPLGLDAGWLPPAVARGLGLPELARVTPRLPLSVADGVGGFLTLSADPAAAGDAIRRRAPSDAAAWPGFTARLRSLAGFLGALYQRPAPDLDATAPGELLGMLGLARRLRGLGREGMVALLRVLPMSVQELLDDTFADPALKAAVAAGGVRDIHQGPRSGGTAFVLLHQLVGAPAGSVRCRGYWRDGPDTLTVALEEAARRHGVQVRGSAEVAAIRIAGDRVRGVTLADGEEFEAPQVLSSAPPGPTLLDLVDPVWLDPEFREAVRRIRYRGVASKVLFALDGLPGFPGLADPTESLAGTVSLTPDLETMERAYDAAKYGEASERPHVELTAPSLRWPALAPPGRQVLVAHVQWTPDRLRGGATWDAARAAALADRVTAQIAAASPGFADRILHRAVLTPRDLAERYALPGGAVTHGELGLDQILFMRPVAGYGRHAMPVPGLFLCGAGAHPGPGVIGGPGWLAARAALEAAA